MKTRRVLAAVIGDEGRTTPLGDREGAAGGRSESQKTCLLALPFFDLRAKRSKETPVRLLSAKGARGLEVRLDRAHNPDVRRRRRKHVEHFLAPPAHADERDSDGLTHFQLLHSL